MDYLLVVDLSNIIIGGIKERISQIKSLKEPMNQQDDNMPSGKDQFHILVVDDEVAITTVLKHMIYEIGFDCLLENNPVKALERLSHERVNLVITDIRMPEMTGVEFANKIAKEHTDIQLAFMSGYNEYQSLLDAVNLQPVGYIQKPIEIEKLRDLISLAHERFKKREFEKITKQRLEHDIRTKTTELAFRSERLAAEQKLMQGIISSGNFGMVAIEPEGFIHLMNEMAVALLGIDEKYSHSYLGESLVKILPDTLTDLIRDMFTQVASGTPSIEHDSIKNTTGRVLNIISYSILDSGSLRAIVLIIHDITEKEQFRLQVAQSARLASIGELAAGVAHEINNPLGFVVSNCNSLTEYLSSYVSYVAALEEAVSCGGGKMKADKLPSDLNALRKELDIEYIMEDANSLLEETVDGLRRMSKIVSDLKMFARSDSDKPENSQVNRLIEDALNLVRNETKYKMEIVTHFGDLPEISCHPNQLVQVFTNLFINTTQAVKNKGTLTVRTEVRGDNIVISIEDDGSGIPEDIVGKIFDPFFTTKDPGKGTGMGLSLSHGIIEKHNGIITVNSKLGVGTEFIINLPLNQEAKSEARKDKEWQAI